jgi:hypothetical protein
MGRNFSRVGAMVFTVTAVALVISNLYQNQSSLVLEAKVALQGAPSKKLTSKDGDDSTLANLGLNPDEAAEDWRRKAKAAGKFIIYPTDLHCFFVLFTSWHIVENNWDLLLHMCSSPCIEA